MKMPTNVRKYFWEIEPKNLDLKKDWRYIISRLLEYGRPDAIKWLLKTYPKKDIKRTAQKSRNVSGRTKAFWSKIKT